MLPEAGYARLGSERIAYQVWGKGSLDLVLTLGSFGASDIEWEDPQTARIFARLGEFARVIRFDRRGTGASDPVPPRSWSRGPSATWSRVRTSPSPIAASTR